MIQSARRWAQGTGLGFSHEEALGDFDQSSDSDGEEDSMSWVGEVGRKWRLSEGWLKERRVVQGQRRRHGIPLRDLKQAWSPLNLKYISLPGTHSLLDVPMWEKTQTHPLLVWRL